MVCNVQCAVCCLPEVNIKQFKFIISNNLPLKVFCDYFLLPNMQFIFRHTTLYFLEALVLILKNLNTIWKYILRVNIYPWFGIIISTESTWGGFSPVVTMSVCGSLCPIAQKRWLCPNSWSFSLLSSKRIFW